MDAENSVDKRAQLDPDRFGYLSLHYVATLSSERSSLTEYKKFSDCCMEIQIRSILQHAWAEIEHDLGYKSERALPKEMRRNFSRIAGLLELADAEFDRIRVELQTYEASIPERITDAPEQVAIDQASLSAFVKTSGLVHKLDDEIARILKARVLQEEDPTPGALEELQYAGLLTIADVESALDEHGEKVVEFAKRWSDSTADTIPPGICLFYLCYILIAEMGSISHAQDYLETLNIGWDER